MNNMSDCYYKKLDHVEKLGEDKGLFGGIKPLLKNVYKYVPCKYLGKQEYTESYFDGDYETEEKIEKYLIEVDGQTIEVYPSEVFIR